MTSAPSAPVRAAGRDREDELRARAAWPAWLRLGVDGPALLPRASKSTPSTWTRRSRARRFSQVRSLWRRRRRSPRRCRRRTVTATTINSNENNNNNNNNNDNNNNGSVPFRDPNQFTFSGDAYNCSFFYSQGEAQRVLRANPSDPNNLDSEDGVVDGIACETYHNWQYSNDGDYNPVQRSGNMTPRRRRMARRHRDPNQFVGQRRCLQLQLLLLAGRGPAGAAGRTRPTRTSSTRRTAAIVTAWPARTTTTGSTRTTLTTTP